MSILYSLSCVVIYALCVQAGRGKLTWSNEFNLFNEIGDNWNSEIGGGGWGNNEQQYYTNLNARTEAGNLVIETRREQVGNNQYTSSRLLSKQNFTYGVFEMSAKLPKGRGTWPAFWLLGAKRPLSWPLDGEIDVMEHVGYDPNRIHGTIHCKNYYHSIGTQKGTSTAINDAFGQYHTYTLEWGPTKIQVSVDGLAYFNYYKENSSQESWPFDNPHNMILNTAVGGDWGGAQGVDVTIFPVQYTIDYVRVYEYVADPAPTVVSVRKVSLRAKANNRYVSADQAGSQPLIANKDTVGEWESFDLTTYSDGTVSLKSFINKKFVSISNYSNPPMIASKDSAGDWEVFVLVQNSDNTVSFKAKANSKYVVTENYGLDALRARADAIDDWEKFTLTYL